MALWYRYQSLSKTPLWKDLSRQIEEIHAMLLDPRARAMYDELLLLRSQSVTQSPAQQEAIENQSKPAVISPTPAERISDDLLPEPRPKFHKVRYLLAVATALMFNQIIDWMSPQTWSEIATIGWLVLFFCIATTGLLWSAFNLLAGRGAKSSAGGRIGKGSIASP